MSIQTRLTLIIMGLISATLIGTLAILGLSEFAHLRHEQERESTATLEKLASVCKESVMSHNDVFVVNYLQTLKTSPGFVYAAFVDPQNVVQVHTDASLINSPYQDQTRPGLLQLSKTVENQGLPLGTARIGFDKAALEARIQKLQMDSLKRFLWVGLAMLALGFLGTVLLARSFNRPISQLAAGARLIGEGRLDTHLELGRRDELGVLADEFNRMAQQLKELDELKESFLHNVSHDMRSPLTAILAYASTLQADKNSTASPLMKKGLQIIKVETGRLAAFINDILDLAKLEAKKMEFSFRPMDLATACREIAELFLPNAQKFGITLELAVPEGGSWTVQGDSEALHRVVVNLVSNALKFTPENGRIRIALEDRGAEVLLSVQDSGVGIPKDVLPKLFTKFTQVKETRDVVRKAQGTGLGLALVKEIVTAHGGQVGVNSEMNQGAVFYFTVPKAA